MNQQNLQRAMEEARRLVESGGTNKSAGSSPLPPLPGSSRNFYELLREEEEAAGELIRCRAATLRCSASTLLLVCFCSGCVRNDQHDD